MTAGMSPGSFWHFQALGDHQVGGVGGADPILRKINVGSATGSAVLGVWAGVSTTGSKIATIDCSSNTARTFDFDELRCPGGLYINLTGAAADVTIVFA